jgi:hypothetical protein
MFVYLKTKSPSPRTANLLTSIVHCSLGAKLRLKQEIVILFVVPELWHMHFVWVITNLYISVSITVLIIRLFQAVLILYVNCKGLMVYQNDGEKYITERELLTTTVSTPIVLCQITSDLIGIFTEL